MCGGWGRGGAGGHTPHPLLCPVQIIDASEEAKTTEAEEAKVKGAVPEGGRGGGSERAHGRQRQ